MTEPAGYQRAKEFTRRALLQSAAGVLVVGLCSSRATVLAQEKKADNDLIGKSIFRTWIEIGTDNVTTIYSPEVEYGQGTVTAIAMLVAEELDCDWHHLRVVQSGTDQIYANPLNHQVSTNSSAGIRYRFDQMRRVGAVAREMLRTAAAERWRVAVDELITKDSHVIHVVTQRKTTYGSLSAAAARVPMSNDVALRDRASWRLIGKATPRLDIVQKTTGQARYAVDLRLPGMLHAAVLRAPIRGSNVVSFSADGAKTRPGVRSIENLGYGVAVVGVDEWTARRALQDVEVVWEKNAWEGTSSETLERTFEEGLDKQGTRARNDGDVEGATKLPGATVRVMEYTSQFLHHMCMEPMSSTAWVHDGICEVWSPTNGASNVMHGIAFLLGLSPDKVVVRRSEFIGGSFGRRDRLDQDIEAVQLSQRLGVPVQVIQRREHDTKSGFYRPYQKTRIETVMSADGKLISWNQKIAVQSMTHDNHDLSELKYTGFDTQTLQPFLRAGGSPAYNAPFDFFSVSQTPFNGAYSIPNIRVEVIPMQSPLPITYWRSVGQSNNTWEVESVIDELACAADIDPVEFRKALLPEQPRARVVLDELAARINWRADARVGTGKGWGVALSTGFGSYVAMAAEVEVSEKRLNVRQVVVVVDQGITVNPDQSEAQVQGGVADGLSAAILQRITLRDGKVEQSNWFDYPTYHLANMPPVQVYFLDSGATPLGSVSESSTPLVMPALLNALFAATGERIRELPLVKHGYEI